MNLEFTIFYVIIMVYYIIGFIIFSTISYKNRKKNTFFIDATPLIDNRNFETEF